MYTKHIQNVLISYINFLQGVTKVILFLLVYDRETVLPIDKTKLLMIYEYIMSIIKENFHIRKEVRLII